MSLFDFDSIPVLKEWEIEAALILKTKLELYETCKRCYWCDADLVLRTATLEHLIPRMMGGTTSVENGALACKSCNKKRGTLDIEEFRSGKWLIRKRAMIEAERRNRKRKAV